MQPGGNGRSAPCAALRLEIKCPAALGTTHTSSHKLLGDTHVVKRINESEFVLPFPDFALPTLALGFAVFLIGGAIKGTLGIGMPLFIVPVMATVIDPVTVIALLFVPILVTNLLQMAEGGHYQLTLRRFWSLILPMIATTIVGASALARIDAKLISLVLGCIVATFCILQTLPLPPAVPKRLEAYMSPIVGSIAGLLGGVSTLFGPPLIMYLISLRLTSAEFIAAIAQLFFVAGAMLYIALAFTGVLTLELAAGSVIVTLPVAAGLALGRRLRGRIRHDATFQRILIVVLLIAGLNLVRRGLV